MTLDLSIFVSLAFLFGIAAQFRAADGYSFLRGIISALEGRLGLMYAVAAVALLADLVRPSILPYVSPAASGEQPYTAEFFGLVSAAISNVPATQLVLSTSSVTPHAAPVLAVDAGLAGNIDPISSFANLLGLVMVGRSGLPVRKSIALQLAIGLVAFLPAAL